MSSKHLRSFRLSGFFFSAPARRSCQLPALWRRRYEVSKPGLCLFLSLFRSCWETPERFSLTSQQKQQDLKRVEKWLKMVKNWDKYRNSEKVCEAFHPLPISVLASLPPFLVLIMCFIISFFSLNRCFPFSFHLLPSNSKNLTAWLNSTVYFIKPHSLNPPAFRLAFHLFKWCLFVVLSHVFSWWNVCIKASLCSSEVRPGLCCWTLRKSSRTTKENMRWDDWRRCHF